MRKQGSCRFAAYYKVQYWDDLNCAWKDVQQSHATKADAHAAFIIGKKCRVMEIDEKGRRPV